MTPKTKFKDALASGKKCFIDLDETIVPSCEVWFHTFGLKKFGSRKGFPQTWEDVNSYTLWKDLGQDILDDVCRPDIYEYCDDLIEGANLFFEKLNQLIDPDKVFILTSTYKKEGIATKNDFIKKHLGISENRVIHTFDKYSHYRGHIIIDDAFLHLEKSVDCKDGSIGFLVDKNWNKEFQFENRISGLKDLI